MPGTLPVLNGDALRMAVRFGLAIGAEISRHSIFDRKNYFYPDLPKGYQTSQLDFPIVGRGSIVINLEDGTEKRIGVTRAHMEEDAGKSLHEEFADETGIDLNRAGTPLLEIVSDPDLRNAREAVAYLKKMHSIVRYLDISDGDMSQGSMRCDANVSIRPRGEEELGTRTEIKNVNSFRFVEKAINYEIRRQQEVLEDGGRIVQETRLYDSVRDETRPMRGKEVANDYRYFPEPRSAAGSDQRGSYRADQIATPRVARCPQRALRKRIRIVRLRCRSTHSEPGNGQLLRTSSRTLRKRQAGRQLGQCRIAGTAKPRKPGTSPTRPSARRTWPI